MLDFYKSTLILIFLSFFLINGCSKEEEKAVPKQTRQDHVWKSQTQALEKAKEVEQVLMDADKKRRQTIDE